MLQWGRTYDDLLNVRTTNLVSLQLANLDDVDGAEASTVAGSHIHVYDHALINTL